MKGKFNLWSVVFVVFLGCLIAIGLGTASDYGLSWDYEAHDTYGKRVIEWYSSPSLSHYVLENGMKYYGPAFELLVGLFRGIFAEVNEVTTKSAVGFLVGILGVISCYSIGVYLGSQRAGIFSALLLALTPMYYGHSFINHKDMPFAVMYIVTLSLLIRSITRGRELKLGGVVAVGITLGVSLAVRMGGVILLPIIALAWGSLALCKPPTLRERVSVVLKTGALMALMLTIAWLVMITLWPFAMVNPVRGPIDVLRLSSAYPWSLTVLFEGQHIAAANLPARYIFVWFLNTLPEVFIAALFIGTLLVVFRVISRPKLVFSCDSLPLLVLLVSIAFPIASIIIKRSVIYDAVRHLLFVVPPLAVLGGVALDRLLKDIERGRLALVLKGGVYVLLSLGLGVVAFDMYLLHPYQYVYFNRLVMGGLPKAYGQFETEYWATCFKESVEWVRENRGSTSSAVKVAGWSDPLQLTWYLSSDESRRNGLVYTADESDADIYIATSRWNAHYRSYKLIHTIDRQGVPLCFIFDRRGF